MTGVYGEKTKPSSWKEAKGKSKGWGHLLGDQMIAQLHVEGLHAASVWHDARTTQSFVENITQIPEEKGTRWVEEGKRSEPATMKDYNNNVIQLFISQTQEKR